MQSVKSASSISRMKLEGFSKRVAECNEGAAERHTFVPFFIDEAVAGYLKPKCPSPQIHQLHTCWTAPCPWLMSQK